jgi:hypothetical protein
MNSPGPWIERSTWLSAAKCSTARGRWCASSARYLRAVADVGLDELRLAGVQELLDRRRVACVGQLVEHQDGSLSCANQCE